MAYNKGKVLEEQISEEPILGNRISDVQISENQTLDKQASDGQISEGQILEGRVNGIKEFGAFIDLPGGESGLVHISQISSSYVNKVEDYLSEGQNVKVKVLGIKDPEPGKKRKKISLSIREAENSQPQNIIPNKDNALWQAHKNSGRYNKYDNPKAQNFEDMMAKFKRESDEKMSDLNQRLDSF
jgi:Predicted RNA binding protein (contains ribosomal protein S1 domain)